MLSNKFIRRIAAVSAVSVAGAFFVSRTFYSRLEKSPRVVFLTGGASGLGKQTAKYLLDKGDTVIAADIVEPGLKELELSVKPKLRERLKTLLLDVNSTPSVAAAVKKMEESGIDKIDSVVNFAGLLRVGPLVELEDKDFAGIMNVNLIGPWRINKHLFPLVHKAHGRYINISSEVAYARFPQAFNGPYCISKIALDAYSDALRQEMMRVGVNVVTLHSGAMKTPLLSSKGFTDAANKPGSLFKEELLIEGDVANKYMEKYGGDPAVIAEKIYQIVHASKPRRHYAVNLSPEMRISRWVPQTLLDVGIEYTLGWPPKKRGPDLPTFEGAATELTK
jgi:NAD(P)-dependent dehydrogenase (short-subunit alcohol dehydrogenase family)